MFLEWYGINVINAINNVIHVSNSNDKCGGGWFCFVLIKSIHFSAPIIHLEQTLSDVQLESFKSAF